MSWAESLLGGTSANSSKKVNNIWEMKKEGKDQIPSKIFSEKKVQSGPSLFNFNFVIKFFKCTSQSSAIMFQFNAYRPIKNQSQTFFESRLGAFGRKTFQDLLGHNDVRGDHQTTAFVVVSSLSSSAYFHKANFCR